MARNSTADVLDSAAVVPVATNFDFLEGSFAATQRNRRIGIGVVLAAAVTLVLLVVLGLNDLVTGRNQDTTLTAANTSAQQARITLAKIDTAGGISADQITAHVTQRSSAYTAAVAKEVDVVALVKQIEQSTPAGVLITAIKFAPAPTATPANSSTSTSTSTSTGTGTATPGGAAGTASSQIGSVEIDGTANSFGLIKVWSQQVGKLPGLASVNPTWTGGEPSVATILTASITPQGLTARSKAAAAGKVGH